MSMAQSFSFAGASQDRISFGYPLGFGYRWYLPQLMRFNAPDDFSPFGSGGGNAYAYCVADPINYIDPTGHTADFDESDRVVAGIAVGMVGMGAAALAYRGLRGAMRTSLFRGTDGTSRQPSGDGEIQAGLPPGAATGDRVHGRGVSNPSFLPENPVFPSTPRSAGEVVRNPAVGYADDIPYHLHQASLGLRNAEATVADLRANTAAREEFDLSDLAPEIASQKQYRLARQEQAIRRRGRRQLAAVDRSLNTATDAINRDVESLVESRQVERLSQEYLRVQRLLESPGMLLAFRL